MIKKYPGIGNGDRPSRLTLTFCENKGFLKRFLARFLADPHDIEDIVQETYLRAYSATIKKDIDEPKAFLFRIARNLALNELTKKSRTITQYLEDCDPSLQIESENNLEAEVEALQTIGAYCQALVLLPEKCRKVYLLRKVHGLSHNEIAEHMGLSISSVEKYLTRGMLHCKSYIEKSEHPRHVSKNALTRVSTSGFKDQGKAK